MHYVAPINKLHNNWFVRMRWFVNCDTHVLPSLHCSISYQGSASLQSILHYKVYQCVTCSAYMAYLNTNNKIKRVYFVGCFFDVPRFVNPRPVVVWILLHPLQQ